MRFVLELRDAQSEADVYDADFVGAFVDEDVGRFDASMDDSAFVEKAHRAKELLDPFEDDMETVHDAADGVHAENVIDAAAVDVLADQVEHFVFCVVEIAGVGFDCAREMRDFELLLEEFDRGGERRMRGDDKAFYYELSRRILFTRCAAKDERVLACVQDFIHEYPLLS